MPPRNPHRTTCRCADFMEGTKSGERRTSDCDGGDKKHQFFQWVRAKEPAVRSREDPQCKKLIFDLCACPKFHMWETSDWS